jgi:hypothetical protein
MRLGWPPMPACIRWVAGQPPGMAVHGCRARWALAGCPAGRMTQAAQLRSRSAAFLRQRKAGGARGCCRAHAMAAGARAQRPARVRFLACFCGRAQHPAASSGAVRALGTGSLPAARAARHHRTARTRPDSQPLRAWEQQGQCTALGLGSALPRARTRAARPLVLRAKHSRLPSRRPLPAVQGRSSAAAWLSAVVALCVVAGASAQPSWQNGVTAW